MDAAETYRAELESEGIVEKLRCGDPEVLREVVESHMTQILRAAMGAGLDRPTAEDVTQATFVTFIEVSRRFEGRSKVRTFLFGILYKKIAEARRAVRKQERVDAIDETMEGRFRLDGSWQRPPRPVDLQLYDEEIRSAIEDCLEDAPTAQRLAFVLRDVEGLSTEEICKILDVSRTNLGVMLYRIRNRLRECLENLGVRGAR